jgi:hypothetical protein
VLNWYAISLCNYYQCPLQYHVVAYRAGLNAGLDFDVRRIPTPRKFCNGYWVGRVAVPPFLEIQQITCLFSWAMGQNPALVNSVDYPPPSQLRKRDDPIHTIVQFGREHLNVVGYYEYHFFNKAAAECNIPGGHPLSLSVPVASFSAKARSLACCAVRIASSTFFSCCAGFIQESIDFLGRRRGNGFCGHVLAHDRGHNLRYRYTKSPEQV